MITQIVVSCNKILVNLSSKIRKPYSRMAQSFTGVILFHLSKTKVVGKIKLIYEEGFLRRV
jgi:hypothetical protein